MSQRHICLGCRQVIITGADWIRLRVTDLPFNESGAAHVACYQTGMAKRTAKIQKSRQETETAVLEAMYARPGKKTAIR